MEIKNSLMKGVDPYKSVLDAKNEAVDGRAARADGQTPAAPQTGDRVSLSPGAMLHNTAHAAMSRAPEVRQEKVDGLKERVADGSYTVDSKKVAEKLVQSETLLAGTLRGGA